MSSVIYTIAIGVVVALLLINYEDRGQDLDEDREEHKL